MSAQPMVDFKLLKERVSIQAVAELHYNMELREKGSQLVGECPLCRDHTQDENPEATHFKITPSINAWKCFSCQEHGNVLDFVAKMENTTIRNASTKIADWFLIEDCFINPKSRKPVKKTNSKPSESKSDDKKEDEQLVEQGSTLTENKPLDWPGLQNLECDTPEIREAGLKPAILAKHGAGWCSTGMMKERLAVPFRNSEGELLGYCGISLTGEEPTYKWPATDKFNPDLELFNFWNVMDSIEYGEDITIASNILEAFELEGEGVRNVMARTGAGFSSRQIQKINGNTVTGRSHVIYIFVHEDELEDIHQNLQVAVYHLAHCNPIYIHIG